MIGHSDEQHGAASGRPRKPVDLSGKWHSALSGRPFVTDQRYFARYPDAECRWRHWLPEDLSQSDIDNGEVAAKLSNPRLLTIAYRGGRKLSCEYGAGAFSPKAQQRRDTTTLWSHLRKEARQLRSQAKMPRKPNRRRRR
jgi:hypothetical protein